MNTTDPLQLKCGNPEIINNPASFSRFVLPFAFRLERLDEPPQGLCYEPTVNGDMSDKRRKKYLTNETALVLFERAKWFEINEEKWKKTPWESTPIIVTLKTGVFQIKMLPPAVVLFEFSEHQESTENSVLQTGFLYVDIYFPETTSSPTLDDLLVFNELFRYFDMPYEGHADQGYKACLKNIPVDYIDNNPYQKLESANDQASYFTRWLNLLKIPITHDGEGYALIPNDWMEAAKNWIDCAEIQQTNNEQSSIVHVDNRCYVWTSAFIDKGGQALNKTFNESPARNLYAHHYGHWVKLLNIDSPGDTPQDTHKTSNFEKEWAKAKTYKRWEYQGMLYGFNDHSGVMLADASPPPHLLYLCRVFREQYFDQTLLLLYLRTTLFRFSRKLSLIVHEQQQKQLQDENKAWLEQIRQVRREFSRFAILYQFPSLSNQQQAIEMYALARECLDVDVLYREVQEEIANTHDFLEQAEANKLGRVANMLAEWGIPLAVASVVASVFGMNAYCLSKNCTQNYISVSEVGIEIGAVMFALLASAYVMWRITKTKE